MPVKGVRATSVPAVVPAGNEPKLLRFIMNHGSVPVVPVTFTNLNIGTIYLNKALICKPT